MWNLRQFDAANDERESEKRFRLLQVQSWISDDLDRVLRKHFMINFLSSCSFHLIIKMD